MADCRDNSADWKYPIAVSHTIDKGGPPFAWLPQMCKVSNGTIEWLVFEHVNKCEVYKICRVVWSVRAVMRLAPYHVNMLARHNPQRNMVSIVTQQTKLDIVCLHKWFAHSWPSPGLCGWTVLEAVVLILLRILYMFQTNSVLLTNELDDSM